MVVPSSSLFVVNITFITSAAFLAEARGGCAFGTCPGGEGPLLYSPQAETASPNAMAPKGQRRVTQAPIVLRDKDLPMLFPLSNISMCQMSGWRIPRDRRKRELRVTFLDGLFGQSALCEVSLLKKTDEDGKNLIDDGRATVETLLELEAAFTRDPEQDPMGNPWHANLVVNFESGMPVRWVEYTNDDLQTRKVWNIAKHDEANNKFDRSSIAQKVDVAMTSLKDAAGDSARAKQAMLSILGEGAVHNVKRWLRAANGVEREFMEALLETPWLPDGFVFDNVYMLGGGAGSDRMLGTFFKLKALELAKQDRADNADTTTYTNKSWVPEVCARLKVVDSWRSFLFVKFGDVARNSEAVKKLVDHLCTKPGLAQVQACMAQRIALHGSGHGDAGISECRALFQELTRCKAGGLPPPAIQPDALIQGGGDPQVADQEAKTPDSRTKADEISRIVAASLASEDAMRVALQEGTDAAEGRPFGVDQREYELFTRATRYLDPVSFMENEDEFKAAATRMFAAGRTCYIIDLPTSRKGVIGAAIDLCSGLLQNQSNARLITTLQDRTDILHDVGVRLQKALPNWYHIPLSQQLSDSFKAAYARAGRSYFIYFSIPPEDKLTAFPNGIRSSTALTPGERLRFLCTNPKCPYYDGAVPNVNGDKLDQIDPDHKEVDLNKVMDSMDAHDESESTEEVAAQALVAQMEKTMEAETPASRAGDKYVFTHVQTIDYYSQMFVQLGAACDCRSLLLHTSSLHPSPWMAARKHSMSVFVFAPRTTTHAQKHGWALLLPTRLNRAPSANRTSGALCRTG